MDRLRFECVLYATGVLIFLGVLSFLMGVSQTALYMLAAAGVVSFLFVLQYFIYSFLFMREKMPKNTDSNAIQDDDPRIVDILKGHDK